MESKKTLNSCLRWKMSRYRPRPITPISSAARPIRATRANVFVPEKLNAKATTRNSTERPRVTSFVTGALIRLPRKSLPNSATAVIVTSIAQT